MAKQKKKTKKLRGSLSSFACWSTHIDFEKRFVIALIYKIYREKTRFGFPLRCFVLNKSL